MRLLIFALLITVVYSWEDIVDNIRFLIYRRKRRTIPFKSSGSGIDDQVSLALLFFAIPFTLLYFLSGSGSILFKLTVLLIELILIALISSGISIFNRRLKQYHNYQGMEKVGLVLFAGMGLVSPTFQLIYRHASTIPELISKFSLLLCLPIMAAWALVTFTPKDVITGDILPNLDTLSVVAVGGLFILIAIRFLEEHFRIYKFSLLPYTRVLLGIILLFILSEGIV